LILKIFVETLEYPICLPSINKGVGVLSPCFGLHSLSRSKLLGYKLPLVLELIDHPFVKGILPMNKGVSLLSVASAVTYIYSISGPGLVEELELTFQKTTPDLALGVVGLCC